MKIKFTPLVEEASKKDLFKNKTHENVAEAIHRLLNSNKGQGQTIGLEGDWGSGKSTVISLLKGKLPADDFKYFYFDAWAHEGDPLRRVFLESLIDVIGDEKLEDLKERISNRKKTVKSKYSRQVTALGKWLSLSLFLVPLGAAMVSTIKFNTIDIDPSHDANGTLIIGVICALAPLLIVFANVIRLLFSKQKRNDPKSWSFLISEGEDESTQEISEDEERSSIEFEGYFDEIISLSFEKNKDQQLVMVIDNLDRIDADVSLRIWSTLQTFLKQRNPDSKEQSHAGNIWVIVPYDLDGLSKLWIIEEENCAQSFFDKCFQLRFEVPRPVFTDWEEFCSQMIQKAFGANFKETESVINILKLTRKDLKDIPTPREIKTYVNQLGVLFLSNNDNKPIESLAYYAIQRFVERKSVKDIQSQLIDGTLPTVDHISNLPGTIIKDLAGLSFGVSSTIGQQLLLEPEIETVLKDNDTNKILQLVETHKEGFWFVFNHHVKTDLSNIFNYTSIVKKSLTDKYSDKLKVFVKSLKKTSVIFDGSLGFDNHLAYLEFISEIKISLKSYWNKLVNHIEQEFNDANFDPSLYIDFITKANSLVEDKYKTPKTISSIDPDLWFKWFDVNHETDWVKWFVPKDQLIDEIGNKIPINTPPPAQLHSTINALVKIGVSNWNGIATPIKNHLLWNNGSVGNQSHSIEVLKAIYKLSLLKNEQVDNLIVEMLSDASFYNFIYLRRSEGSIFLASILQVRYGTANIHDFSIPTVGNSQHGINQLRSFWNTQSEENAKKVYDELNFQKEISWKLIQDERNKLMIDVVKIALEKEDDFFSGDNAYSRYSYNLKLIKECEDIDENAIAKRFVDESKILEELNCIENIDIKENSQELFLLLPLMTDFKKISELINQINKDDWDTELNQNTYLSSLILELSKKSNFKLGKAYYESLLQFVSNWFNGDHQPTDWQLNQWTELLNVLDKAFLTQLKNHLTQSVVSNLDRCSFTFFKNNKKFIDVKKLTENKIQEIQILIEDILKDELDSDKLKLIVLLIENQKPKFDKNFGKVVSEDLSRHFHNTKNSVKDDLNELANHLNIEIEEGNPDSI